MFVNKKKVFWGFFSTAAGRGTVIHWIVRITGMIKERAMERDGPCSVKSALIFCFDMLSLSLILCDDIWLLYT